MNVVTRYEIPSLTGLRGVAATLVMVDHYAAIDFSAPPPLHMLPHMYLAVDMFMMLSGFILAMTYGDRLGRQPLGRGYARFVWRRIARLYPLYALTTVVCFGLCRAGWLTFLNPDTSLAALVANLLAVQTWSWPGSSLNGPGWSISTEWFANLVFPLLVPLVLGGSAIRAAGIGVLAFALVVVSAVMTGQLFDVPSPGAVNVITGPGALGRCLGAFAIGMCCWRLRARAAWTRVLGGTGLQLLVLLAMLALMQDTALDTVVVALCAPLLIGLSFEASVVSAVLRTAVMQWLGRISYSIYLVHITLLPVRDALARGLEGAAVPGSWVLAVACCVLLTLLIATLTWRYVEGPARTAMLLPRRRRSQPAGRTSRTGESP